MLLKHLIGLLRPDTGTVKVFGQDFWSLSARDQRSLRRRYGLAFQEGALFDSMSVGENIAFPLVQAGQTNPLEIKARVAECLALVRLTGIEGLSTSELSTGMRRRVGFARAIALEPQILLFDEPNTGLDPVIKAVIDELIVELQEKLSSTTVTITHDLNSAYRIADRLALLFRGKIVAFAAPEAFRELDDARVQQFLRGLPTGPLSD